MDLLPLRDAALEIARGREKCREVLVEKMITGRALQCLRINLVRLYFGVRCHARARLLHSLLQGLDPLRVVGLRAQGGLMHPAHHPSESAVPVPIRQAKTALAHFLRSPVAACLILELRRQQGLNRRSPRPSEMVIAIEIEVDVLVKRFLAGDYGWAVSRQRSGGIECLQGVSRILLSNLFDHAVDTGVGPKGQGVKVTCELKMFTRGGEVRQAQQTLAQLKLHVWRLGIPVLRPVQTIVRPD